MRDYPWPEGSGWVTGASLGTGTVLVGASDSRPTHGSLLARFMVLRKHCNGGGTHVGSRFQCGGCTVHQNTTSTMAPWTTVHYCVTEFSPPLIQRTTMCLYKSGIPFPALAAHLLGCSCHIRQVAVCTSNITTRPHPLGHQQAIATFPHFRQQEEM